MDTDTEGFSNDCGCCQHSALPLPRVVPHELYGGGLSVVLSIARSCCVRDAKNLLCLFSGEWKWYMIPLAFSLRKSANVRQCTGREYNVLLSLLALLAPHAKQTVSSILYKLLLSSSKPIRCPCDSNCSAPELLQIKPSCVCVYTV